MLLGKLAVQMQYSTLTNTTEGPLFQEAFSPVKCILFHHLTDLDRTVWRKFLDFVWVFFVFS